MPESLFVSFVAGMVGTWRIDNMNGVIGESLPMAKRLEVHEASKLQEIRASAWVLGASQVMLATSRRSPNSRVTRGHLTYLPLDLNEFPS